MGKMKIALCTQGSIGIMAIRKLFEIGINPADILVFTYDIESKSNKPLINFLDFFQTQYLVMGNDMEKMSDVLKKEKINMLLSIAYKYIFKGPIFEIEKISLINLHPGTLPLYKGWLSVPWAIFNGEKSAGYTYHLIDQKIDNGAIIYQEELPILESTTAFDMHFKLMNSAINKLDYIISGNWNTNPQEPIGKYYKNIMPNQGYIDKSWDIKKIDRFIRAMYFPPYQGAMLKTDAGDKEILDIKQYLKETHYE